jgi:hypothetical protein
MHFDELESISSTGSKRGREEEEEDASWTEADLTAMQNASLSITELGSILTSQVLAHPFRPLKHPYPPGELPPAEALDDLTHQLVKYAYRPSPVKKHSRAKTPPPQANEDGWTHTWEATRRKLFRFALAESQVAHGAPEDRKAPRNERVQRPGLKRMDSMDFMDQDEEMTESDKIGRALRLSTSLQNSSKQCPPTALSRCPDSLSSSSSSTDLSQSFELAPSLPSAITITPSSPAPRPSLRRRGSSRLSQTRSNRPSLLQRGRSFTASDLEIDSGILASPTTASRTEEDDSEGSVRTPPKPKASIPSEQLTPRRKEPGLLTIPAYISSGPRLTRSQSNEQNLNAHATQKSFIATRQPTTNERAALALPFEASPKKSVQNTNYGWSDSEDESQSTAIRHVKKSRPPRAKPQRPTMIMPFQPLLSAEMLGGTALRSPFEEKSGMGF